MVEVVGGGGVAPLAQRAGYLRAAENVFYDLARGQGLAKKLALLALDYAREQGFKRCYLETTAFLTEAIGYMSIWLRTY
jgi:putative acetyltransferase